jgi:polysaccharide export outer membrane protein
MRGFRESLPWILAMVFVGCAGGPKPEMQVSSADLRISEFMLSPGDEILISVYKHEDLGRRITIPPDGLIFFPAVGEIDTTGMGVRELRTRIAEGLSAYRQQAILPGDTVTISVFLHEEYDRRLIVPSDGQLFFPHVGEIDVESMTLSQLRETIAEALADYVIDPQVIIDIVDLKNPARIVDPQVTIELVGLRGQRTFVLGEVRNPGAYVAGGGATVVEMLSMAGGLTSNASDKGILLARSPGPGKRRDLALVSLRDYLETGDAEHNPLVQSGDIIYVHRSAIANVDRFFARLATVVRPIVDIETGYWLGQNIVERTRRNP